MLKYFAIFALFGIGAFSTNSYSNTGINSKYIIYAFGAGSVGTTTYFPYAIEGSSVCQPAFFSTSAYTFTCAADGSYVTVNLYGNQKCTGTAESTTRINSTSMGYDTTVNKTLPGAFNCTGTNDYAVINFAASNAVCTASTYITIYAAINRCIRVPNIVSGVVSSYSNLNIYCNNTDAQLQYFDLNDTSCVNTIEKYFTANKTCGYMFSFAGTTEIYGYVENCTQGTQSTSSDANIIGYGLGLMISAIVAILNK